MGRDSEGRVGLDCTAAVGLDRLAGSVYWVGWKEAVASWAGAVGEEPKEVGLSRKSSWKRFGKDDAADSGLPDLMRSSAMRRRGRGREFRSSGNRVGGIDGKNTCGS